MVTFLDRACCPWVRAGNPPYSFCPTCTDKHHTIDFSFSFSKLNIRTGFRFCTVPTLPNSDFKNVDIYTYGGVSDPDPLPGPDLHFAGFKSGSRLLLNPDPDQGFCINKNFIQIYKFEKQADPIRIRIRITGFTPKLSLW
jgi:hypothetical protein